MEYAPHIQETETHEMRETLIDMEEIFISMKESNNIIIKSQEEYRELNVILLQSLTRIQKNMQQGRYQVTLVKVLQGRVLLA
jgi:hypothetical protein